DLKQGKDAKRFGNATLGRKFAASVTMPTLLNKTWDSIKYYATGLYRYVDEDHCFLLSAGIAFNVLYCVLPLSLVMFYFFSATLTSERAVTVAVQYIVQSFPVPLYEEDVRMWLARQLGGVSHAGTIAGIVGG